MSGSYADGGPQNRITFRTPVKVASRGAYVRLTFLKEKTLSLNLEEKKAVVAEVSAEVAGAQLMVLAEYHGTVVTDITTLRADARKNGVYFRVIKNTLARLAVKGTPFEGLADQMTGPLVYGLSKDPVAAAKVMNDFAKGKERFVIKGGAMPNQVMSVVDVQRLASLPSRNELLSKLLGTMQAPMSAFARGLAAVRDQKEAA